MATAAPERYFHVDRTGSLQAGMTIERESLTAHPAPIPDAAIQRFVEQTFPDGLTRHGMSHVFWQQLAFPRDAADAEDPRALGEMRNRTIELVWELARRARWPTRPSRYECVFAWQTPEDARRFSATGDIWEVEAADAFRADMSWLRYGTAAAAWQAVDGYWSGQPQSAAPVWEIVLVPPVRVLRRR